MSSELVQELLNLSEKDVLVAFWDRSGDKHNGTPFVKSVLITKNDGKFYGQFGFQGKIKLVEGQLRQNELLTAEELMEKHKSGRW